MSLGVSRHRPSPPLPLMCGLAGLSLAPGRELDASGLLRLLAAGMGERGRDASGFAYPRRGRGGVRS